MTAEQAFEQVYNGQPNFMTPNILRRTRVGRFFVELSQGWGFSEERTYGVTVLEHLPYTGEVVQRPDLNELFMAREDAAGWISDLEEL